MYYYNLIFVILFLPLINSFCCLKNNITQKEVKCIADYLVLVKNIKTEIFAEKINDEWIIQREIYSDSLENIIINKKEMKDYMGEKYAENCFKNFTQYITEKTWKLNNNTTKTLVIWDCKKLNIDAIFYAIEKSYLILSEKIKKILDEQLNCLINLLLKKCKNSDITILNAPNEIKTSEDAIKDYYKINIKNKNYVLIWKNKKIIFETINSLKNIFTKKADEIKKFNKCHEILFKNMSYHNKNIKSNIYNFKNMYKRLNIEQFYFKKIPILEEIIQIQQNEEQDINCPICLDIFQNNEKAIKLIPCGHLFHDDCILNWFLKNGNCPICRQKFEIKFTDPEY